MYKKKKYLGVILARGGSKRLPGKNLKKLNGKPLIAYSILAGLKCKYLDMLIVSSEDKNILNISKKYGAETIKRPKYLASDKSKSSSALKHVLENISNFDYLVLLQPTSPLRNEKHICEAINLLEKKNADAIISVCKLNNNSMCHTLTKNFDMKNFFKSKKKIKNYYKINGAIYICKINFFLKENSLFLKNNIYAFEMTKEESIDIDTEFDFKMAEILMKN